MQHCKNPNNIALCYVKYDAQITESNKKERNSIVINNSATQLTNQQAKGKTFMVTVFIKKTRSINRLHTNDKGANHASTMKRIIESILW